MSGNTIGKLFQLTTFGESHGEAIGGILDGMPPQILLDINEIQTALNKRRPGYTPYTTPRPESDQIQILSGVFENKTLGTPIAFLIKNENQRSNDYQELKDLYRPGHGDYTYDQKYGHRDYRGGGRASARETAARVAGGAMALMAINHILKKKIQINACVQQLGGLKATQKDFNFAQTNPFFCPDSHVLCEWEKYLTELINEGKSCGAEIYFEVKGVPAGLGEPVFDKLNADLAKALMSINAAKAVAFGDEGFNIASSPISFDEMYFDQDEIQFSSNKAGGILAGISTGQPITGIVAFKATTSTRQKRKTITQDNQNIEIEVKGRHDPCVALRAVPIVEAMIALTLADHLLRMRGQCGM